MTNPRRPDRVTAAVMTLLLIAGQTLAVPVGAQGLPGLPAPGTRVSTTARYTPTTLVGMTLHPEDPFLFDFIVRPGDDHLQGEAFQNESAKLIRYFLAALTVPENDLWVNLSPYEQDRIIPDGFGDTEMGRDLLAQDYLLKQLTASLLSPEDDLGSDFWQRVYQRALEEYGTTEIPMNTFNKVWIVPDQASVSVEGTSVYVVNSHHQVMLEEDYLALDMNQGHARHGVGGVREKDLKEISAVSKEVIREIILPEIEREVNAGKNFANLRQISNAVILATWYKRHVMGSLLSQHYTDQNKTRGIDTQDKQINQKIYQQYVEAFRTGVLNVIREEYDPVRQTVIPRKYFSGGVVERQGAIVTVASPVQAMTGQRVQIRLTDPDQYDADQRLNEYVKTIGTHDLLPTFSRIFASIAEFSTTVDPQYVYTDGGG